MKLAISTLGILLFANTFLIPSAQAGGGNAFNRQEQALLFGQIINAQQKQQQQQLFLLQQQQQQYFLQTGNKRQANPG